MSVSIARLLWVILVITVLFGCSGQEGEEAEGPIDTNFDEDENAEPDDDADEEDDTEDDADDGSGDDCNCICDCGDDGESEAEGDDDSESDAESDSDDEAVDDIESNEGAEESDDEAEESPAEEDTEASGADSTDGDEDVETDEETTDVEIEDGEDFEADTDEVDDTGTDEGTGTDAENGSDDDTESEEDTEEEIVICPDPLCGNTNRQNDICESFDGVSMGNYYLLNNLWGNGGTVETDGQCSWPFCDEQGGVAWGTEFLWTSGEEIGVKSYAAIILGWHWSDVDPSSGLPVQLSSNPSIPTEWSFQVSVNEEASLNVAYDLWIHDTSDVNSYTTATNEVMVWLYAHNKDDPIGEYQDTVTVADDNWDLYEGMNGDTEVHSFVRVPPVLCAEFNLMDFLNELINREMMDPEKYLIGIEAGPEVVMGEGNVITERYSVSVQ